MLYVVIIPIYVLDSFYYSAYVPDNIITDAHGKIIAHTLNTNDLNQKIEDLLKEKE
jgi:cell division protein FtsL